MFHISYFLYPKYIDQLKINYFQPLYLMEEISNYSRFFSKFEFRL